MWIVATLFLKMKLCENRMRRRNHQLHCINLLFIQETTGIYANGYLVTKERGINRIGIEFDAGRE